MNLCRTVKNVYHEDEIFGNILEHNEIIPSYIDVYFHNMEFFYEHNDTFLTHAKRTEVYTDTFDMIELIWFYPKTDSLLNSLFLAMHDICACQRRFKDVLKHNWDTKMGCATQQMLRKGH